MRLSTVALSLIALGVTAVAAAGPSEGAADLQPKARDFARKIEARDARKAHTKRRTEQLFTDGMLTWYGGGQLSAPACGGATPKSSAHVVAVNKNGPFKCGDTVHIHHAGKMVPAKVVDYCEGCTLHHLDLTQGLFQEFASLDAGVIHGAHVRLIPKKSKH